MDQPGAAQSNGRRALVAAWLGWAFDGLDGYLFIGVALQLVRRLVVAAEPELTGAALDAAVTTRAAWIQGMFFVGWALGGAVFGRIGDRIGRTKVLSLTILTYALFTGLGFFATEWWHLLIFRFLAALGIGGEWAAGSALVAETLNMRHKAWASALLQSGYILGIIAATLTGGLFKTPGTEHYVFLVGVLPALCVLWIRQSVHEPPTWKNAAAGQRVPRVSELFAPGVRHVTLTVGSFVSLSLVAVWVFIFFTPQVVRRLALADGAEPARAQEIVTLVSLSYFTVNLVANFTATYLAKWLGERRAFALLSAGALVSALWGYHSPQSVMHVAVAAGCLAYTGLGMFAIFPLYIPPLFPTLLRTLGAGFTYNVGRLVTAAGTVFAGQIAAAPGGPAAAIWWAGWLYVPCFVLALVLPRGRGVGSGER